MDLPSHNPHSSHAKDSADLSYSQLVEVPADVFRLHHLRTLRLDNNALTSVPWSSLMALTSLTHVNLSRNKLSELPEALSKWNTVEVLDVSHNNIGAFSQALWPLLLRSYYVITFRSFKEGKPDPNDHSFECPHLTRALIKQFGNKLPASFRAHYPPFYYSKDRFMEVTANPQIEIMDYASSAPHILWQPLWANRGTMLRKDVRPGKPHWKLMPGATPRIKLDGNPVLEKMPRLETHPIDLAGEWEAATASGSDNGGDNSSDSDGSAEAKTDRKKDGRENTRRVRRERRHMTKGNASARDAKMSGAP